MAPTPASEPERRVPCVRSRRGPAAWGSPNRSSGCGTDKGAGPPRRPGDAVENFLPSEFLPGSPGLLSGERRRDPASGVSELDGVSARTGSLPLVAGEVGAPAPRSLRTRTSAAPTSGDSGDPGWRATIWLCPSKPTLRPGEEKQTTPTNQTNKTLSVSCFPALDSRVCKCKRTLNLLSTCYRGRLNSYIVHPSSHISLVFRVAWHFLPF